ncbi:hypothetical protein OV203_05195 [Nannocystis sp. ILAH1]|uniref:hypothetical protein n=1 Tax=unclassified Nannocystis TaxID=2627009 RepID=UPI00226D4EB6|nr:MULTISPECIES: hypothetical protein [unclassified Nannocystis]MCY0986502.1 hypothetical protein [Nannocystis sp. ILAH1]MCY1071377.1 hypothetical protein [Nannocystis sp. RBIL2]
MLGVLVGLTVLAAPPVANGETEILSVEVEAPELGAMRRKAYLSSRMSAAELSGTIGADLVRAMGQVVLDKAVQAGWEMTRRELMSLAKCGDKRGRARAACAKDEDDPWMPTTYRVLESSRLQDLMAQPETLLRAVLGDWFDHMRPGHAFELVGQTLGGVSVERLIRAWRSNGKSGLSSTAVTEIRAAILKVADKNTCEALTGVVDKALWVGAMCVAATRSAQAAIRGSSPSGVVDSSDAAEPGALTSCQNFDSWIDQCHFAASDRELVVAALRAHATVFEFGGRAKWWRDAINLVFELAKIDPAKLAADKVTELEQRRQRVEWMQAVIVGLLDEDWTRVAGGATSIVADWILTMKKTAATAEEASEGADIGKNTEKAEDDNSSNSADSQAGLEALQKVVGFLAGIGRYAASYSEKDSEVAAQARKDAIADLVSRMASRRERTRGAVFSLGGSFGFVAGVRSEVAPDRTSNLAPASPIHLGLGLGVDTYHGARKTRSVGFHGEVSVLDLGQYVAFENRKLDLKTPELAASLAPSIKLGIRVALRETPLFLALFGGFNPFLRTKAADATDGNMTFTLGAMFGVYVPFLDFN